jgi:D-alanyl-D-alanine carboxypeptidase
MAKLDPLLRCALLLVFAGCGSSRGAPSDSGAPDASDDAIDAGSPDAGDAGDDADGASTRSAACIAQDQALQKALDGARGASNNALLAVRNPDCGTTVYLSGSPKTATPTSLWRIGSVTKTFVSASILSLVKEGMVALADPLSKWVPNVPGTTGVTVTMLMDHRSGIFNYTDDPAFLAGRGNPWTPQQIVTLATMHAPYFAPDADFHYSNTNYILLGMILEAATGQKAGAVLHARAIDVAKLGATLFDSYDTIDPSRMTRGFAADGTDVTFVDDPSGPWTAGSMVSDGGSLADWIATLYDTDTVLDAGQRALLQSRVSNLGNGVQYGLGVILLSPTITAKAGPGIGHDGAIDGFMTQAFYFPDHKLAIVSIVNDDAGDANAVTLAALTKLFP